MQYPKTKNLKIYKNAEFKDSITLVNTNYTPKNLTGYVAIGQMKRFYDSTFGIQIQCSIPNPLNGQIKLFLPSTITQQFEAEYSNNNNTYNYDVVLQNIDTNQIERVQDGLIYIIAGITNLYDPNIEINVDPTPDVSPTNDFLDGGIFQ